MPERLSIGGFFGLETGFEHEPFHHGAEALSNGRACLYVILQETRPGKVYVPFYSCNALILPLQALSVNFEYYSITERLDPAHYPALDGNEMFLFINYFGVKGDTVAKVIARYGQQAIIDNSHAFFERGYQAGWSFNSVRKVFGVPDGGYLYGPPRPPRDFDPPLDVHVGHLIAKVLGKDEDALREFQRSERLQSVHPYRMSRLTHKLLGTVDYRRVMARRRENFDAYRDRLSSRNQLVVTADSQEIPFCYPFLPESPIPRSRLHRLNVFVAQLWKDVAVRSTTGFIWERRLADQLLPLPVDHRLERADVDYVVEAIDRLMAA